MKKFVDYRDTKMKAMMTDLEKYFEKNVSASGFLVGNKVHMQFILNNTVKVRVDNEYVLYSTVYG